MSAYSEFFLGSTADVRQLELFEITHPDMTQAYRFCLQALDGITVNVGDGPVLFPYYPAEVQASPSTDDLEAEISVQLGDLGETMPTEIDAIAEAGGMHVRPIMRYWVYRSDDLSAAIYGPIVLEVETMAHEELGSLIEAHAPRLNATKTGERYEIERFPMLRGFVN